MTNSWLSALDLFMSGETQAKSFVSKMKKPWQGCMQKWIMSLIVNTWYCSNLQPVSGFGDLWLRFS